MKHIAALGVGLVLTFTLLPAGADPLVRLQEYIALDTTNPPGNESRGAAFFAAIFDAAGIKYETVESAPGRGNIWARIPGGDEPALVLLHHMDVVPASVDAWQTDPLKPTIKDGVLYGRGAIDIKSLGIAHLEAFLALHRSGVRPHRDVIFMATADEEAGGLFGAGWLVENRRELFDGVGYLLNEGGAVLATKDHTRVQIETAQKRPYWLRLVATDEPGHGSSPRRTSATTRLVTALHNIYRSPFAPRITAPVRAMTAALAPYVEPEWQSALADIDAAILQPGFIDRLQDKKHRWHALLRNTCSITVLDGSAKINVVPASASAELDCRILPDQSAPEFIAALASRIDDERVQIEEIMLFGPAESSTDTPLYRLLAAKSRAHYPGAGVLPAVSTGFTDSHFFREIGIVSYGYGPFLLPESTLGSVHGNDERIVIENFRKGVVLMREIVAEFAGGEPPKE
jgi:acetylornithine deacetylase/succinyl-diaminopimelate desuccinylase-like protein